MEFASTAEYLGAFRVPLLEEVRAQLHQALEKSLSQGEVHAVRVTKMIVSKAKNQDSSMRKFNLSLKRHARGNTPVRHSDLILLCCGKRPKWDSIRECLTPQRHHKFVLVNVVYARDGSPVFTATAYLPRGSPILEKFFSPSATWFVVLLGMSLIPADRIWKALNKTDSAARGSVTQDLLQIYQHVRNFYQFP